MESTKTTLAPAESRQEGQHVLGRYRLTALHRRDDRTEVWRAFDQSGHIVTLEFLRPRDPAARERFVTDARRMAAFQQPTIIRVAEIHDDDEATFIAFAEVGDSTTPEPLTVKKIRIEPAAVAPTPPPAAPMPPEPILAPSAASELAIPEAAAPERVATDDDDSPYEHGLAGLMTVLKARDLALFESSMLREAANELMAMARAWLTRQDFETRVGRIVAEARARADRADYSTVRSAVGQVADSARGLASVHPRVGLPALPRLPVRTPKVSQPPRVRVSQAKPVAPKRTEPRVPRAPLFVVRVRWARALRRGLTLGLIAAAIIVVPPEFAASVGSVIWSNLDQGVRTVSATLDEKVRAVTTPAAPALTPASFELPPLSAYRAAFDSQAPYPLTTPGDTVEWVVALRNAGSVGWYRGIDGAQASLAFTDGASAGVQSTPYVGPGQVGWFVVRFASPSQPGTYAISLVPRIDGQGLMPDLGIFVIVAVSAKP